MKILTLRFQKAAELKFCGSTVLGLNYIENLSTMVRSGVPSKKWAKVALRVKITRGQKYLRFAGKIFSMYVLFRYLEFELQRIRELSADVFS